MRSLLPILFMAGYAQTEVTETPVDLPKNDVVNPIEYVEPKHPHHFQVDGFFPSPILGPRPPPHRVPIIVDVGFIEMNIDTNPRHSFGHPHPDMKSHLRGAKFLFPFPHPGEAHPFSNCEDCPPCSDENDCREGTHKGQMHEHMARKFMKHMHRHGKEHMKYLHNEDLKEIGNLRDEKHAQVMPCPMCEEMMRRGIKDNMHSPDGHSSDENATEIDTSETLVNGEVQSTEEGGSSMEEQTECDGVSTDCETVSGEAKREERMKEALFMEVPELLFEESPIVVSDSHLNSLE